MSVEYCQDHRTDGRRRGGECGCSGVGAGRWGWCPKQPLAEVLNKAVWFARAHVCVCVRTWEVSWRFVCFVLFVQLPPHVAVAVCENIGARGTQFQHPYRLVALVSSSLLELRGFFPKAWALKVVFADSKLSNRPRAVCKGIRRDLRLWVMDLALFH